MSARKKSEALEIMQDTSKSREEFQHSIGEAIKDFYYQHFNAETTEDICKCSQNSFVAACTYARRECIARDDLLCFTPHVSSGRTVLNEQFDKDKVDIIAQIYLDLAFLFDKVPSIFGFAELTGIDRATLQGWIKERKGVSMQRRDDTPKRAIQKIKDGRAESLQNLAITGGKPTVGAIAVLNNSVWQEQAPEREESPVLSVYDLPTLDDLRHMSEIEEKPRQLLPHFDPVTGELLKEPGSVHTL